MAVAVATMAEKAAEALGAMASALEIADSMKSNSIPEQSGEGWASMSILFPKLDDVQKDIFTAAAKVGASAGRREVLKTVVGVSAPFFEKDLSGAKVQLFELESLNSVPQYRFVLPAGTSVLAVRAGELEFAPGGSRLTLRAPVNAPGGDQDLLTVYDDIRINPSLAPGQVVVAGTVLGKTDDKPIGVFQVTVPPTETLVSIVSKDGNASRVVPVDLKRFLETSKAVVWSEPTQNSPLVKPSDISSGRMVLVDPNARASQVSQETAQASSSAQPAAPAKKKPSMVPYVLGAALLYGFYKMGK